MIWMDGPDDTVVSFDRGLTREQLLEEAVDRFVWKVARHPRKGGKALCAWFRERPHDDVRWWRVTYHVTSLANQLYSLVRQRTRAMTGIPFVYRRSQIPARVWREAEREWRAERQARQQVHADNPFGLDVRA